jgi:ligand-binding sensor domain-containing protein
MRFMYRRPTSSWSLVAAVLLLAATASPTAQQASFRTFGVADGLTTETVTTLMFDSRGFLWLGTRPGVSRFDGRQFVNYGTEHGLPLQTVNHLMEDRDGSIWESVVAFRAWSSCLTAPRRFIASSGLLACANTFTSASWTSASA